MAKSTYTSKILLAASIAMLPGCTMKSGTTKDTYASTNSSITSEPDAYNSSVPAFEWRCIYSPSNAQKEVREELHTQHVDYDWALWGHNLWKIVGKKPESDICATVDGKKTEEQYCFSSDKLYNKVEEYIVDQYGYNSPDSLSASFTIMPLDNKLACTCSKCLKAGNTPGNATPAVSKMLTKLAKKFPHYRFFTSSYNTTTTPPTYRLPSNVGVLISSIKLPMRWGFQDTEKAKDFRKLIDNWKKCIDKMYIWEYYRNYDDYITPYPCLSIMQQRLQFYHELGVKGIFLNGSGDDYCTFDDVQTYVLGRLLENPYTDVQPLIEEFYTKNYPEMGNYIARYYQELERQAVERKHILLFYDEDEISSPQCAVNSYLDPEAFETFWKELDRKSKSIEGEERHRISEMLTALCYTRLEMDRKNIRKIDESELEDVILILKDHKQVPNLINFKETDGDLDKYMKIWNAKL